MSPRFRQIATLLLLIFGVQVWLVVGRGEWGSPLQLQLCIGALSLAAIPPIRRRIGRFLDRLRRPSPRARVITAAAIFVIACVYLPLTAARQQRNFYPESHDQRMYTLQARMLAHGRLWMPQHPAADSFETFYVLVKPKYAPTYFPGTALMLAPAIGLGLPSWFTPLLITFGIASLMYVVVTH